MNKRMIIFIVVAVALSLLVMLWHDANQSANKAELSNLNSPTSIQSVPVEAFGQIVGETDTILLDVRTPSEYAEGRITGAQNIDFYNPEFRQMIAALDKDKPYAVYCRSGNRTSQTLVLMRSLGFTDVTELSGGIIAWQRAGNTLCQITQC